MCHFYAEKLLRSAIKVIRKRSINDAVYFIIFLTIKIKMRYEEFCSILDKLFPGRFNFEFNLSCVQVNNYYAATYYLQKYRLLGYLKLF